MERWALGCRAEALARWYRWLEGLKISPALVCDRALVSHSGLSEVSAACIWKEELEMQMDEPWPGPQPLCKGNLPEKGSNNPLSLYLS